MIHYNRLLYGDAWINMNNVSCPSVVRVPLGRHFGFLYITSPVLQLVS